MSTKADFELVAMTIKRYGNHVGYNTYQFREFKLHEAADAHVIRFGYARVTLDPKTGEVSDKSSLLNRVHGPWMAQNDDSELFDAFVYDFLRNGVEIDGSTWLGDFQYKKTSIGQQASMETITDHKTSCQVVKLVVDENGYGRVFMRYLGFDHDSFSRAYDEIKNNEAEHGTTRRNQVR